MASGSHIAVAQKETVPGFDNWTSKAGVWHCEAPRTVLDKLLFVRVHLDDANAENGAMQIALGSHKSGLVKAIEAKSVAQTYPQEICHARRGDVFILKMLTLHASKPAKVQTGRRVLRIDYAADPLPMPLKWDDVFT